MRLWTCQAGLLLLFAVLTVGCGPSAEEFALAGQEAVNLARESKESRDWTRALEALEEAQKRDPALAEVYRGLAVCRMELGDAEGAAEALRGLLRLRPDDCRAHLLLAQYAVEKKNWDDAVDHIVRAGRFAQYRDEIQETQYWHGMIHSIVTNATPETTAS
ncbi:MAG: tetratricopeptide repeat protein, partial [bacterium]